MAVKFIYRKVSVELCDKLIDICDRDGVDWDIWNMEFVRLGLGINREFAELGIEVWTPQMMSLVRKEWESLGSDAMQKLGSLAEIKHEAVSMDADDSVPFIEDDQQEKPEPSPCESPEKLPSKEVGSFEFLDESDTGKDVDTDDMFSKLRHVTEIQFDVQKPSNT